MSRPRLLFVDDEPEILELLALIFSDCESRSALNVEAAKTLLRAGSFDLIVTDIKMPGGSGFALIDFSKHHWPDLPIVIITGHLPVLSPAENQKVHSCIRKPFGKQIIRSAAGEALATKGVSL